MWEDAEIFAGVAGSELDVERVDLGDGITLSQTYAHASAGFFMWFERVTPENPFPNQLKNVEGGFGYDIMMQLHVPVCPKLGTGEDRLHIVKWIATLLRLIHLPEVHIPIVSTGPFSEAFSAERTEFRPLEIGRRFVLISSGGLRTLRADHLRWLADYWRVGLELVRKDRRLSLAITAFDDGASTGDAALYMLSMWSGLEALFSQSPSELSFRLSSAIATYLEPPGKPRYDLQKHIKGLYDVRSKIAHGVPKAFDIREPLIQTDALIRKVLRRIIETNEVPSSEGLMQRLFGDI